MIDRSALLSLLVCPACRAPLESFTHCSHCKADYSESDGTPVLIPTTASRKLSFDFPQSRSTNGEQFTDCFSYPPRCGAAGSDKPYHLDLAHLDIFDRLPSGASILEIGCGGGQMRSFLESKQFRYLGIDISKTRVDQRLQLHGGPDLLCDCHFLPFNQHTFDIVYSAGVTEHLACPYLVVQEVARVLKPGGYYLGNVSFLEPWHDDSFFHMSPLGVFELLTQADFEIIHIWPGKGYSGFRAILNMGNKATRPLTFLGDLMYFIYNSGNRLRNLVKRRIHHNSQRGILDAARVAGATDWIARRRLDGSCFAPSTESIPGHA
ncbi:methyltransferase domain-containing protein [Microseira sp. BLCC-F43]|uniref:methyltransferase domain-containing protein n=1 Tax=Microseira sp. BLCC-F43 TaxID=3153602 RepID=UPI0035B6ECD2